jgi:hypothetical protein
MCRTISTRVVSINYKAQMNSRLTHVCLNFVVRPGGDTHDVFCWHSFQQGLINKHNLFIPIWNDQRAKTIPRKPHCFTFPSHTHIYSYTLLHTHIVTRCLPFHLPRWDTLLPIQLECYTVDVRQPMKFRYMTTSKNGGVHSLFSNHCHETTHDQP